MSSSATNTDWTERVDPAEIEAAQWIACLDAGLDASRREQFEQWLRLDPKNQAAYSRLASVWEELARVAALRPVNSTLVDPDLLREEPSPPKWQTRLEQALEALSSGVPKTIFARSWGRRKWGLILATSVVLLAALPLFQFILLSQSFETSVGEVRRIELEDSSTAALNTRSSLAVHYSADKRSVVLRNGEVHFRVAKDASRPFVVSAGQTQITAIGTAFVVRVRDNAVDVTVTEGTVRVSGPALSATTASGAPAAAVFLSAGQEIIVRGSDAASRQLRLGEADRRLAWEQGLLAFEGDLLGDAIAEVNRHNRCQLVILDPQLAALRLGGRFRANDCSGFVQSLQRAFDIDATQGTGQTVFLKSRQSK